MSKIKYLVLQNLVFGTTYSYITLLYYLIELTYLQ